MSSQGTIRIIRAAVAALLVVPFTSGFAQSVPNVAVREKEIAITIDDLPLNGPEIGIKRLRRMTGKILAAFTRAHAPVVGFVNESLLYVPGETDDRIEVLRSWTTAGFELGNHSYSHVRFADVSLSAYEDDFVKGETVTEHLMKTRGQKPKYFRHPYLKMGATAALERSFENFIAERGYRIAPVTVDSMDWMFLAAFRQARDRGRGRGQAAGERRISQAYLDYFSARITAVESVSNDLFGHGITQILLLHANELNAEALDRLLSILVQRGYRFVTLEQALQDPVFRFPDRYRDTSDWLIHWAFSLGKQIKSPAPPAFIQTAYAAAQKPAVKPARKH
ncbi:MAG: polysaccharide deacetylase family protein [Pyrinomonadaceae bacterium]